MAALRKECKTRAGGTRTFSKAGKLVKPDDAVKPDKEPPSPITDEREGHDTNHAA